MIRSPAQATVQQLKDAGNWIVWCSTRRNGRVISRTMRRVEGAQHRVHQSPPVLQRRGRRFHESRGALAGRGAALAQRRTSEPDAGAPARSGKRVRQGIGDRRRRCRRAVRGRIGRVEIRAERRRCDCAAGQVPRCLSRLERWRERDGRCARRRGKSQARVVSSPLTGGLRRGRHAGLGTRPATAPCRCPTRCPRTGSTSTRSTCAGRGASCSTLRRSRIRPARSRAPRRSAPSAPRDTASRGPRA